MRRVALKRLCTAITRGSAPTYSDDERGSALVVGQSCQRPDGAFDLSFARWHVGAVPHKGRLKGREILVNSTGTGTLGRVAFVSQLPADLPVFVDTHVTMLRVDLRRADPRFLAYFLGLPASRAFIEEALSVGATNQRELSVSAFRNFCAPVLPLDRQRIISDFLDRECERIAALDRELADVREVAAAAMDDDLRRLVLEGNYPFVPLKYYAKPGTGHTPSREHPEYWIPEECVVPWFTLADVHQIRDGRREVVTETSEHLSEAGIANSAAVKHPAGTVLLSRTASVGFSAVMGVDMAVSQDFMTWTCGPKLDPFYLLVALRAMQPELRRLMQGSTHKTIYMPDLHALRIPLPPLDRQREIVAQARAKAAAVWPLVDETVELRRCLAEYRDALITEAVTGKLDPARVGEPEMEERMHAALEGAVAP